MISVLIADDHAVVRTGLVNVLASARDMRLAALATDGEEAVAAAQEHEVDVVLMDLVMPGTDGVEATKQILAARPETKVVVLTSFSDRGRIMDALDAGAIGYLLKDTEPGALLEGIRAAARGESPLDPKVAHALLAARTQERPAEEALSNREREVLALVAAGRPNKQIARSLGITEATVKAHLTRIYRELGVFDRTQAALWVHEHGLSGT
jgi:DNA-binding NarL/FixJ family response regulator